VPVIAVASGKGGTGKTTVAVNLAWTLMLAGIDTQYLDCDVEEPNGALFLKPQITSTHKISVEVPHIDQNKCTLCGKCGQICRFNAIVCSGKIVMTFDQLCHSCGGCRLVCPANAIEYVKKEIGTIDKGSVRNIEFCQGKLNIGNIHSPVLIKQVKELIQKDKVVIIDAPPGTSCPAVEAVKDVDYVLLVAEPTPFSLYDFNLTVDVLKKLKIPFGAVINKAGSDKNNIDKYFKDKDIDILAVLPFSKQTAYSCSKGELIAESSSEYAEQFNLLAEKVGKITGN